MEWTGPSLTDWIVCEFPNLFLQDSNWVNQWDEQLFTIDYREYKCERSEYYDAALVGANTECQTESLYSKDNLLMSIHAFKTLE